MTTATRKIAEFTAAVTLEDIPAPVLDVARLHLLDGLGIGIASTAFDFAGSVRTAAAELGAAPAAFPGGGGAARELVTGKALPAASAALVNGTLIHGLDFDDTHIAAIYHATGPALATALAVGEERGASGRDVLTAYVLGLEVGCRLALAARGRFHDRGFHPTGIIGTFAAACVAAKLRDLTVNQTVHALGICGSQAAGTLELGQSWLKRLHPGWASHGGITAAALAAAGFRGPDSILDGPRGLFYSHLGTRPDSAGLGADDLGARWTAADIAIKPYPCCHFTHGFIDAALSLVAELGGTVDPATVASVTCPTAERLRPMVTEPPERRQAPRTLYEAQFSVQYVVACALVSGRVDLATFYDEPYDNPDVLAVAARTTCPVDPGSDYPARFPGEVRVEFTDGRTVRRRVPASLGTPGNLAPEGVITGKFRSNATRVLPADQAERLAKLVLALEDVTAASEILDACARLFASGQ